MMGLFLYIMKKVLGPGDCLTIYNRTLCRTSLCYTIMVPGLNYKLFLLSRYVPSVAALPILRPSLGGKQSVWGRAKAEMQGYLNLFLGNLDIVNSREVRMETQDKVLNIVNARL